MADLEINLFGRQLDIHIYALCILARASSLAVIMTSRRLTKRGAEPWVVLDIALWAVPLGIIGARIYHVLTHPDDYFGAGRRPAGRCIRIWEGGIAIYGALIGGAIGVLLGCRMDRHPVLDLRRRARARACSLAQAIGRLRQLVQPGALRPAHRPAVGPRDRRRRTPRSPPAWPRARCSTRRSSTR